MTTLESGSIHRCAELAGPCRRCGVGDARRACRGTRGPLDGIPYTAKDSYLARGLTAAAGSPAFADLVAQKDAFVIERLRDAGAVLVGLTNMPPMANGGMQRGLYGRAESPYNAAYLTAAFGSGSSNGSGTATAASFCAFGLGEETWSSGRAPASNNALCAYTPWRGVISTRGGWPLVPTMDVVVPHTRTMADMLEVLDVIVADDTSVRGDFWRSQPWIALPRPSELRPTSYPQLRPTSRDEARQVLAGRRLGVPRMYINADPDAGTAEPGRTPGIGGPTGQRVQTRPSVLGLFDAARRDLEAAGAEVVDVDFPVVSNYEGDRPGAPTIFTRGLVSRPYLARELLDLSAWAWDDFLDDNSDPALNRWPTSTARASSPTRQERCPTGTPGSTTLLRVIRRTSGITRSLRSSGSHSWRRGCEGSRRRGASISRSGWALLAWTRSFSRRLRMSVPRTWTSTSHRPISVRATASGSQTGTWRYGTSASPPSPYRWARWTTPACRSG